MSANPHITRRLLTAGKPPKSILPTGSLKFEGGVLYIEAKILTHDKSEGNEPGFSTEWIPAPPEFVDLIKKS